MTGVPLLLVDGHNLLFRAWYGFPARIWSRDKGTDLTGVFGFLALLRAGLRDNLSGQPEVIVVFDGENGPAARRAAEPGYKSTRPQGTPEPVKALPDVNYQPVRNSFGEDHVVVELLVTGTLGDGSKARFHACDILTLRDGLIAAKRSYRKVVE